MRVLSISLLMPDWISDWDKDLLSFFLLKDFEPHIRSSFVLLLSWFRMNTRVIDELLRFLSLIKSPLLVLTSKGHGTRVNGWKISLSFLTDFLRLYILIDIFCLNLHMRIFIRLLFLIYLIINVLNFWLEWFLFRNFLLFLNFFLYLFLINFFLSLEWLSN